MSGEEVGSRDQRVMDWTVMMLVASEEVEREKEKPSFARNCS